MKIAVLSDIHDNIANLQKCLEWCRQKEVERMICCGDVTNVGTLAFLTENFGNEILLVRGNLELYEEKDVAQFPTIRYLGRKDCVELAGKNIGICHEPFWVDQILADKECDIIFYGHTHKPWIEHRGKTMVVNPGTLGGVFEKAAFAFWDTSESEPTLVILELI